MDVPPLFPAALATHTQTVLWTHILHRTDILWPEQAAGLSATTKAALNSQGLPVTS